MASIATTRSGRPWSTGVVVPIGKVPPVSGPGVVEPPEGRVPVFAGVVTAGSSSPNEIVVEVAGVELPTTNREGPGAGGEAVAAGGAGRCSKFNWLHRQI